MKVVCERFKAWVEVEGLGATQDEIVYILEGLKLASAIEGVFAWLIKE